MIFLTNITHALELTTSSASVINYYVSYVDHGATGGTPGDTQGSISSATTTTILSAPAAATQRQIKFISVEVVGTGANSVMIKKDVATVETVIYTASLQSQENLTYCDGKGFEKHVASGDTTEFLAVDKSKPVSATAYQYFKVGTGPKGAGIIHSLVLSSGMP